MAVSGGVHINLIITNIFMVYYFNPTRCHGWNLLNVFFEVYLKYRPGHPKPYRGIINKWKVRPGRFLLQLTLTFSHEKNKVPYLEALNPPPPWPPLKKKKKKTYIKVEETSKPGTYSLSLFHIIIVDGLGDQLLFSCR